MKQHLLGTASMNAPTVSLAGSSRSFISGLSLRDLDRLRGIVRARVGQYYPDGMSDYEADRLIESWGPEAAGNVIRRQEERKIMEGLHRRAMDMRKDRAR